MGNKKSHRKRLTKEERKVRIIEAAYKLFARKGFRGTSTSDISKAAGINKALIFRDFGNKEKLLTEIIRKYFHSRGDFLFLMKDKMEQKDDIGVLKSFASGLLKNESEDPDFLRLVFLCHLEGINISDIMSEAMSAPLEKTEKGLSAYFENRIADGALRSNRTDITARLFSTCLLALALSQQGSLIGPAIDATDEEVAEEMANIFINGLKSSTFKDKDL